MGPRRAVARPAPPPAARGPDRRARGLLRGVRLSRRSEARARPAAGRTPRGLRPEPRPGRQSRDRRPASARQAARRGRGWPVRAADAAPVHGRGVRRAPSVPVLHRPHRPCDRRGDARGAEAGVRALRCFQRRGRAGPAASGHLRALEAGPLARRRGSGRVLPRPARAPPRAPAGSRGLHRPDGPHAHRPSRSRRAPRRLRQHDGRAPPVTQVWPGAPFPLGAIWDGEGTNFSIFSEHGERVELCLFDESGREERVALPERTAYNWHGYLPGIGPGQRYGFRVHGPYEPARGLRFNPAKLLIDPYAKAIDGTVDWAAASVLPYVPTGADDADLELDDEDDAAAIPKSIVVDPSFDWEDDRRPNTPWTSTVIYETHVKGFTQRLDPLPEELRGTYAGLASAEAIEHLTALGVTAIELLPVHHIVDESFLVERGLTNYWGYSSIGYFAPHAAYSASGTGGEQVREFRGMVKALHRAGIEVILDVVYNHTAEGNHLGPMLSFKGVDNASYYRLSPEEPRHYVDFTGTGNSLNPVHPSVLRLIMDSLRYWAVDCRVDGFRFDLASALAREFWDVDRLSAFFDVIHQDPVLSQTKLIAEPWDVGPGGYQVGNFPVLWTEWNGLYRDEIRDFWRGASNGVGEFAARLTGSSDLYADDGRRPFASINFVTAHDGFTLADLVSYNEKHNDANLEGNRDGTDDNRSWNCGVEGPTDDPVVNELRRRQMRNFLTTLLLSQGVPMLLGGDELARSQGGNNNAWCQDNEISWFDWETADRELLDWTKRVIELRRRHPVFRRRDFLHGEETGSGLPDVWWFRPDGRKMARRDWERGDAHALGCFLNGQEIPTRTPQGRPIGDDSFLLIFNAYHEPIPFKLPARRFGLRWQVELDSFAPDAEPAIHPPRAEIEVKGRSILLLRRDF